MRIIVSHKTSPVLKKFFKDEFEDIYSQKYFGKETAYWNRKWFYIKATLGKEIIGAMLLKTEAGIGEVESIVVKHTKKGQGIGKILMKKAEEITEKEGGHKIYLMTGETWGTLSFYKSLGFSKVGELKNHFFHADFIQLEKSL
jgi:ribosomal protein S18 acetylase RimI-like enzyme